MVRSGDEQVSRRFVSEYAGEYPVTRLCVLVDVPRSSFSGGATGHRRAVTSTARSWLRRSSTFIGRPKAPTVHHGSTASCGTGASGWVGSGSPG